MDDEPDQRHIGRASRRASKTRQRLLDAALHVFNNRGIEACSIEDITESADVGKGTFYRHFMDKLDILKSLLDLALDDLVRRLPATNSHPVSLEDRLTQIVAAHMTLFTERADLFNVFLQGQSMVAARASSVPGIQPPFTRYVNEIESRLIPALAEQDRSTQAHRLALAIAATVCGTVTLGLANLGSKHDIMNTLDQARQTLLAGLRPVTGQAE